MNEWDFPKYWPPQYINVSSCRFKGLTHMFSKGSLQIIA